MIPDTFEESLNAIRSQIHLWKTEAKQHETDDKDADPQWSRCQDVLENLYSTQRALLNYERSYI